MLTLKTIHYPCYYLVIFASSKQSRVCDAKFVFLMFWKVNGVVAKQINHFTLLYPFMYHQPTTSFYNQQCSRENWRIPILKFFSGNKLWQFNLRRLLYSDQYRQLDILRQASGLILKVCQAVKSSSWWCKFMFCHCIAYTLLSPSCINHSLV